LKVVLSLSLFLISLQDFYSYNLSFTILSVLGLIILFILYTIKSKDIIFEKEHKNILLLFYIFPLLLSSINFFCNYEILSYKRIIGLLMCVFTFHIFSSLAKNYYEIINKALYFVLIVHTAFFYFNLVDIYFFNHLFDPILLFTNFEMQATHFTYIFGKQILRPCGLFQEPGSYAAYLSPLILFFSLKNTKKSNFILNLSISSLFISLSTFGFILGAIILYFKKSYKKSVFKIIFPITLILLSFLFSIFRFNINLANDTFNLSHEDRLTKENSGFERRLFLLNKLSDSLSDDTAKFLFGYSILNPVSIKDIGSTISSNDSGFFFYSILFNGLIYTFIFYILYFKFYNRNLKSIAFITLLTFSKISIFSLIFPIYLYLFHEK